MIGFIASTIALVGTSASAATQVASVQSAQAGIPAEKSAVGGALGNSGEEAAVPLWRGTASGQTLDEVLAIIRTLPEISEADFKVKKDGSVEPRIKYKNNGIALFGLNFKLDFEFFDLRLSKTYLKSNLSCAGVDFSKNIESLIDGLIKKYPNKLRVVDSNGTELKNQIGFTDGETQVQFTLYATVPPSAYAVASANLEATLAEAKKEYNAFSKRLTASRLDIARTSAMNACPGSEGHMRTVSLQYSARAESLSNAARVKAEQEASMVRDREKL